MNPGHKKRILVLTSRFPYPPVGGEKLRIFHLIENLSATYSVDVCTLYSSESELQGIEKLNEHCDRVFPIRLGRVRRVVNALRCLVTGALPLQVGYYTDPAVKAEIDRLRKNGYDGILVHLIRMLEYARGWEGAGTVLEYTDAISLNYHRIRFPRSLREVAYVLDRDRTLRYERNAAIAVGAGVLVSETDKAFLAGKGVDPQALHVICNGTRLAGIGIPDRWEPDVIAFLGNLRSMQNEDMCLYFANEVFPKVKRERPSALFRIIGANPSRKVRSLAGRPGIEVTGEVSNAAELYGRSCVSVCPMRYGAGIQNKILESMALAVPVVTTSIGLEGIGAKDGEEILVADDPDAFAARTLDVLADPGLRSRLGANGARFIDLHYRWQGQAKLYVDLMEEVMARADARGSAPGTAEEQVQGIRSEGK